MSCTSLSNNIERHLQAFEKQLQKNKPFLVVKSFFISNRSIQHPRDIYPIHEALMRVTKMLSLEQKNDLQAKWKIFLDKINGTIFLRLGLNYSHFDCSPMIDFANSPLKKREIKISELCLKDPNAIAYAADNITLFDNEAFGDCHPRAFFESILRSPKVRVFLATDDDYQVVGCLWGFISEMQNEVKIFHIWDVVRRANHPGLGIAHTLIQKLEESISLDTQFLTLNVEVANKKAYSLYKKLKFIPADHPRNTQLSKVFMYMSLGTTTSKFQQSDGNHIIRSFVMQAVPLRSLLLFSLIRCLDLLWRRVYYR